MSKKLIITNKLLQKIFYKEAKTLHLSAFGNVIVNNEGPERFREVITVDKCLDKFRKFANQEGYILDGSLGFSDHLLVQPTITACEEIYATKYLGNK